MLAGLDINVWYCILTKLSHGILAGFIAWLIGPFFLHLQTVSTGTFGQAELVKELGGFYHLLFSTKMVIMVILLFALTIIIDQLIRRIHERFRNHSRV